jgi:site-specific DNA-cytosine methylase
MDSVINECRTTAYGGRVTIPGGVDLLVAGFSCVDFSNLNNEKKTIKAGGESGDTFGAIKDYAEKHRPKIIILENVDGAPWKAIRDKAMPQIGYAAEFLKVDTKHYYIPQTRKRGYMICVDAREYHDPDRKQHKPKDPKIVNSVLSTWAETLKAFRRPASCPVEAFLLDEDDPRAIRGRAELANSGRGERRRTKEVDWARCHGRHQDYRAGLFLGQKRPLTKWEDGGSCKATDYMWQDWMRGQVERVWDTIDISWLRNLNRGFDHQYKL